MNMTNREDSSAAEHETYPGPGPLTADEAKRAIRPVEQMVDAAIERIARETQARAAKAGSSAAGGAGASRTAHPAAASAEPGHALTLARSDAAALMAMEEHGAAHGSELALSPERRGKGRLRWKGLDVSDEFRSYAERVARGEDLPPFTGKILAEPDPAFPWDPTAQKRAARRALKHQVGLWLGVAAFLGLSVAVLVVQVRQQTDAWQAPESPLATVKMANQPNGELAQPALAENAPAAFSETVLVAPAAGPGAESEAGSDVVAAPEPPKPAPPVVAAAGSAARQPPAATIKAQPAPAAPAVLVATRAAQAGSTAGSSVPGGSVSGGSVPGGGAAAASEPTLKAVGTGGTAAGSTLTAAADVAGSSDSASPLLADPKKETTREASGMGSLLVESPSF